MSQHSIRLTDQEARLLLNQIQTLIGLEQIEPLSQEEVEKIEAEFEHVEVSAESEARMKLFQEEFLRMIAANR